MKNIYSILITLFFCPTIFGQNTEMELMRFEQSAILKWSDNHITVVQKNTNTDAPDLLIKSIRMDKEDLEIIFSLREFLKIENQLKFFNNIKGAEINGKNYAVPIEYIFGDMEKGSQGNNKNLRLVWKDFFNYIP